LKELKFIDCAPDLTEVSLLTELESLRIDYDCVLYEDAELELMFQSLCNLRTLHIYHAQFATNLPKFILTHASPKLECLRFNFLIDLENIAHLLDGTFEEDPIPEDSEMAIQQTTAKQTNFGLKRIEIHVQGMHDEDLRIGEPWYGFDESWYEWYAGAIELVARKPNLRLTKCQASPSSILH